MHTIFTDTMVHIDREQWNALAVPYGNPFVSHEFLSGLERSGCVGGNTGWSANHVLAYADAGCRQLIGAVPMYAKVHSYGEYVFDWAWADAYRRANLEYYPKLVVAVPFTPVTGPRVLAAEHAVRDELIERTLIYAEQLGVSSLHWLFTNSADYQALERRRLLPRVGTQFHWNNQDYQSFEHYLGEFTSSKRKKIKRERRRVREAGIKFEMLAGDALQPRHFDVMYRFYRSTVALHGAIPYLTRGFFDILAHDLSQHIVLILARHGKDYVAGALNVRGDHALYGRYWGASADFSGLHFETCYYRAIEYCINHRIGRFEAGAQGEHKLSRGLLPNLTRSMHWLREPRFASAVADFLAHERDGVTHYREVLEAHSPFRN
ncbi:MAG: GNAT family N-acetyltransferase [Gammaproteobacteria bacterium]|nr:GNAT family N-acetyltransferase [Gammaproteobacteria bacterium]